MLRYLKGLSLLFIGAAVAFSVQAQDAESQAILDKLSAKMKTAPSFSADFESKIEDKQADMESTQAGSVKVAEEKFELSLGDNTVISDGNSVWTYNKESNEVMIDYLEDMFEDDISPSKIYTIWEEGFKHSYDGKVTVDKVSCDKIKLFPNDPSDKNYHTIQLFIDQANMVIKRIVVLGKDGTDITYTISNFQKQQYAGTMFHFDSSKFPGVEVIDNR